MDPVARILEQRKKEWEEYDKKVQCPKCKGFGTVESFIEATGHLDEAAGYRRRVDITCPRCKGTGRK